METITQNSFTDKIIDGLKRAAVELEEFRLQAALGKMEAKDLFDDVKKKLHKSLHEANLDMDNVKLIVEKNTLKIKVAFEKLQVQLALGKAEGRDAFEAQRKKINIAINELETYIMENKETEKIYSLLLLDLKKFRIKLQILKLKFELKEFKTEEKMDGYKKSFHAKVAAAKENLHEKEKFAEKKWKNFSNEMHEAFSHLKTAFGA
ncbi:MAG: hypothetical protein IAF38_17925 [Bacteroidia bacterium]|nr:hypothetical protein [Bacteroidia bacterium]